MHDFISADPESNAAVSVQLHTLQTSEVNPTDLCVITQESFEDVSAPASEDCPSFYEHLPNFCIGRLPCGHHFSLTGIARSFALSDMRCPVCRQGVAERSGLRCIPHHLRKELEQAIARAKREQAIEEQRMLQEVQEDILRGEVLDMHMTLGWDGPGFAISTPMSLEGSPPEVRAIRIIISHRPRASE